MQQINSIFGLNPWRRADWQQITEEFEKLRVVANAVARMTGAGQCRVDVNENGILISMDDRFNAGEAAPASGTAAVVVDWRIDSSLNLQIDQRVLTGVTVGTATNWITRAVGGTCGV